MAEAEVEERPPNPRFFCHKCSVEFDHASPVRNTSLLSPKKGLPFSLIV